MRRTRPLLALLSFSLLALPFVACDGESNTDNSRGGQGGRVKETPLSGGAPGSGGAGGAGGLPSETQDIAIQFRAKIGNEPFACGKKYSAQGSTDVEITPQDLRFFVSDVRLIDEEGNKISVQLDVRSPHQSADVALLDFEDASGSCKNGNTSLNDLVTGTVSKSNYVGLAFSTSVPASLNHENPALLDPPLTAGAMSWSWLSGFKFLRAEVTATAPGGMPGSAIFHLGSTGCDNTQQGEGGAGGAPPNPGAPPSIACAKPNRNEILFANFDTETDVIVIDVGAMFENLDLAKMNMCHSGMTGCATYMDTVGVEFSTGAPKDGQTTFRFETK